jgi:hypothetical protein
MVIIFMPQRYVFFQNYLFGVAKFRKKKLNWRHFTVKKGGVIMKMSARLSSRADI